MIWANVSLKRSGKYKKATHFYYRIYIISLLNFFRPVCECLTHRNESSCNSMIGFDPTLLSNFCPVKLNLTHFPTPNLVGRNSQKYFLPRSKNLWIWCWFQKKNWQILAGCLLATLALFCFLSLFWLTHNNQITRNCVWQFGILSTLNKILHKIP